MWGEYLLLENRRRWRGSVNDFKAIGNSDHAQHHAQVQALHQQVPYLVLPYQVYIG